MRDLSRIDRSAIAPVAGAIAILPMVALFASGLTWWSAQTTVTLALGAYLVAIASTVRSSRASYSVLALNSVGLALATFVGAITESTHWLHIVALALLCFAGGLLVALGPLLAVVGTQVILAFLIFGRFPSDAEEALKLAGLILLGGGTEVAFLSVVRWPPSFRRQRDAIAAAFGALSASARSGGDVPTTLAATELDQASDLLSASGFVGRDDERALRGLIDEARRMRVGLVALIGLRRRLSVASPDSSALAPIEQAQQHLGDALERLSHAIDRSRTDPRIVEDTSALESATQAAFDVASPGDAGVLVASCVERLRALAGQVRATENLLGHGIHGGWHFQTHQLSRLGAARSILRDWGMTLRSNLTMTSPALRHAIRLAVAVPVADLLSQVAGLPRPYWVPLTVAVVLKGDFGSLFTRGAGRVVGTCVGATGAGLLIAGLHPDRAGTAVAVGLTAWGAYTFFQSSFAIASTFVAAIVLLLLSITQINTTTTALDRLLDTGLGGVIALTAYLVWPTWSSGQARRAVARLVTAQRTYLAAVPSVALGHEHSPSQLTALARQVRLAWTEAQATIARSLAEPTKWRVDGDTAQSLMAALLRVTQAAHAIRVEKVTPAPGEPAQPLRELRDGIDVALGRIVTALEENRTLTSLPPLRDLYADAANNETTSRSTVLALDEIVDAIDTAGHLLQGNTLEQAGRIST